MKSIVFTLIFVLFFLSSCNQHIKPVISTPIGDTEAAFEYWKHSPIHPSNNQQVTFQVNAWDESLISKVELVIYEYKLYKTSEGVPAKKRRITGLWGQQKTWDFKYPQYEVTLEYTVPKPFKDNSNIEYLFYVTNVQGNVSTRFATFDAGESPWNADKILLYSTVPTMMEQTINVGFIKDTDFGSDWTVFLKDVEHLVYEGYFKNNMIKARKDKWAFYYTKETANGYDIAYESLRKEIFPKFLTDYRIEGIDVYGLLHREPFKDGAYLMGNLTFLSTNMFTSESYNIGTAVHETAHAVFNLSDEYEGCVCYQPATGANMFTSLAECEAFNERRGIGVGKCTTLHDYKGDNWYMAEENVYFSTEVECHNYALANGYDASDCSTFIDVDQSVSYRSESGLCIMQDDGDAVIRDFKSACAKIITDQYQELSDLATSSAVPGMDVDNIFGYRPVVLMEFSQDGDSVQSIIKNVHLGIPAKQWSGKRALELSMCRKDHSVISKLNIHEPKMVYAHNTTDGDEIKWLKGAKSYIQIPYYKDMTLMECKLNLVPEGTQERMVGEVIEVDFKEQLQKAYRAYEQQVH